MELETKGEAVDGGLIGGALGVVGSGLGLWKIFAGRRAKREAHAQRLAEQAAPKLFEMAQQMLADRGADIEAIREDHRACVDHHEQCQREVTGLKVRVAELSVRVGLPPSLDHDPA